MKQDTEDRGGFSALLSGYERHHVATALAVFFILASLVLAIKAISAIKAYSFIGEDPAQQNTVMVSGHGEVVAVPDLATLTFTVMKESLQVKEAQQEVARTIDTALSFVRGNGVAERDTKTTNYSIYPQYDYREVRCLGIGVCPPPGQPVLRGYQVSQTILVKVRDIDSAGKLLGGLGELGVTDVGGLSLTIDEPDMLVRQARAQAIEKARIEAMALAKDLGVSLGRIVRFSEQGAYPAPYREKSQASVAYGMGGDVAPPSIPVGENTITSDVNIVYRIR